MISMTDPIVSRATPLHQKEYLNRKEAAQYLTKRGYPIEAKTLANLAYNENAKKGPPFERLSWKRIRYNREALDNWVARQKVMVA